jgi:hypothetical protein
MLFFGQVGDDPLDYLGFSLQQLETGFLVLFGCIFGFIVFRQARGQLVPREPLPSGTSTTAVLNGMRKMRRTVVVLPIIFVVASWLTRDKPFLPRLVGAAINVSVTCWFLFLLSRARGSAK